MRIYHNIPALSAYNALNSTNKALTKSIKRLSSGLRINSAADDAAGLAISEKMRAQISGLEMATRNAEDGISMLQTAEGALESTQSILQRMRELSVQAANGTLTAQDRSYIQLEIDQLKTEINNIANTTQFNGKRLLDGSSAGLWSSDKLDTKAYIRGSLREIDQFGQKNAFEGNYKITVEATDAGTAQVQKTDIMKIKHELGGAPSTTEVAGTADTAGVPGSFTNKFEITNPSANFNAYNYGGGSITINGTAYTISSVSSASYTVSDLVNQLTAATDGGGTTLGSLATISADASGNITILFNDTTTDMTGYTASMKTTGGATETVTNKSAVATPGTPGTTGTNASVTWNNLSDDVVAALVADNGTLTFEIDEGKGSAETVTITAADVQTAATAATRDPNAPVLADLVDAIKAKTPTLTITVDDSVSGKLTISVDDTTAEHTITSTGLETYSSGGSTIGTIAGLDTKLRDIDKFWTSTGTFLLDDPKTITITQGDGTNTSITLYSTDTIKDMRDKLNNAIANDIGQAKYLKDPADADKFVTFVEDGAATDGNEAVPGTFLIRSAVSGEQGNLYLSGDEDLINALSLNQIQASSNATFKVNIVDAHNPDNVIAEDVSISGNTLVGVIHPNVDVEFYSMAGIDVTWNDTTKAFDLATGGTYDTVLHLVDNSTIFQVGANEGEDMALDIGNMSVASLGITGVVVTNQETASRSITLLDNAISKVSAQRAKIGAYQNTLEYMTTNLTTTYTNLSDAESRIRDTDMAKEMMEFVKLQILNQSGTAMLAQANQLPQSVLSLIGG